MMYGDDINVPVKLGGVAGKTEQLRRMKRDHEAEVQRMQRPVERDTRRMKRHLQLRRKMWWLT